MPAEQISLFGKTGSSDWPEGFRYHENAIDEASEAALLQDFEPLPFREFQFHGYEGKRRTVSFGWRYDFDKSKALPAEPIPPFLRALYDCVRASTGFQLETLDQALVIEYAPGAGIGWHRDRPAFGNVIGLSLVSPCLFRLRKRDGTRWKRASLTAAPRSAYLLEGPVRWEWEHSIPPVSELRYSVTFRSIRP